MKGGSRPPQGGGVWGGLRQRVHQMPNAYGGGDQRTPMAGPQQQIAMRNATMQRNSQRGAPPMMESSAKPQMADALRRFRGMM